mgnify:CR=1 FL=1
MSQEALGLIETHGLVVAIEAADAMAKAGYRKDFINVKMKN